jgi:hypothetical protein
LRSLKSADSIIVTSAAPHKGIFGAIPSDALSVPLRRLIDGHRSCGHEAFGEAARGAASRRHRARKARRRLHKNQKGCGIRPVTRQDEVSENDSLGWVAVAKKSTMR